MKEPILVKVIAPSAKIAFDKAKREDHDQRQNCIDVEGDGADEGRQAVAF